MPRLLILLLLLHAPPAVAQGILQSSLDSAFLVQGETTHLTVWIQTPDRPAIEPATPTAADLIIKFNGEMARIGLNRQRVFAYSYTIQSFKTGSHVIPAFTITHQGQEYRSTPIRIHVFPTSDLTYGTLRVAGTEVKYYSAVFTPASEHYEREAFPTEVKVYLPEQAGSANGVVAELEHDGIVAWRFEAVPDPSRVILPTGTHTACIFRSTASAIRNGSVQLGPGRARIVLRVRRQEGPFTAYNDHPVYFDVPARPLTARALPAGAPATFRGAVGSFSVTATADLDELEDGDPIAVRLAVTGRGNLDNLPAPVLTGLPTEWKTYEPSRLERQDDRRSATGTVSFSQIIRPLVPRDEVPPFELAYFDPGSARYETVRTPPIPYKARPSTKTTPIGLATPTLATPVEDMQGILGLVDPLRSATTAGPAAWRRLWHLVPAVLAAVLLVRIIRRRLLPKWQPSERERQVIQTLQDVARADGDRRGFLRASGHFIERWIPPAGRDEELQALLDQRDTDCYRPDGPDNALPADERRRILRKLKSSALAAGSAITLLLVISSSWAAGVTLDAAACRQAEEAWAAGNYRAALDLFASAEAGSGPSADILYNIGNCHYRLAEPGKAALHYHRALLADPEHPEARQNLRYLERTLGSITIMRAPHEEFLARLDRGLYRLALAAGLWILALASLGALAGFPKAVRIFCWCAVAGGVAVTTAGTVGLALYPDDARFAPPAERGIVTSAETIQALTEASSAGQKVIDAPPGSQCRILAPRGTWTYVEFADRTRGWLPSDQVSPLLAESARNRSPLTNNL